MKPFATAWVSDVIVPNEQTQVLVFLWREGDEDIRARHQCATDGLTPWYAQFSLKWSSDNEDKAQEYFDQCKKAGSEVRADVEKILKKQIEEYIPF